MARAESFVTKCGSLGIVPGSDGLVLAVESDGFAVHMDRAGRAHAEFVGFDFDGPGRFELDRLG